MRRWGEIFCLGTVAWLAACATSTPVEDVAVPPLRAQLDRAEVVSVPFRTSFNGFIVIDADLDGRRVPMALDTGATRSVLFASAAEGDVGQVRIMVHGMDRRDVRETRRVRELGVRGTTSEVRALDLDIVVLPDREDLDVLDTPYDGLIGMDVMAGYALFVDRESQTLSFIPEDVAVDIPDAWHAVDLTENPFLEDGRDLHYVALDLREASVPALIDTGSAVNLLSWSAADFPQVRRARKRLRERWEVQGALGAFRPKVIIEQTPVAAGGQAMRPQSFLVKNMESLDILGITDQPFAVAGARMFADASLYLDFPGDRLAVPRATTERQLIMTGSRVGSRAGSVVQVSPGARR